MIEFVVETTFNLDYWLRPQPFVWTLVILGYFFSSIYCAHDSIAETDVPATYWGLLFMIATFMLIGVHRQEVSQIVELPIPQEIFEWGAVFAAVGVLILLWLILVREIHVSPPHKRLWRAIRNFSR